MKAPKFVIRLFCAVVVTVMLAVVLTVMSTDVSAQTACPTSGVYGKDVGRDFFVSVVAALKDVRQNDFAVDALMAWAPHEGTKAYWNPLATTWRLTPICFFNCLRRNAAGQCTMGVQNYTSQGEGVRATANTLNLSYYNAIRMMLNQNSFDREAIRSALGKWGTCKGSRCDPLLNTWQKLYDRYQNAGSSTAPTSGGLDLSGYCQSKGYAGATLLEHNAFGWACQAANGATAGMDLFAACRWQHGGALPIPRYSDFNDPYSWQCHSR